MDKINLIIRTLGLIEVRGKDNLNMLLGCIQELERLRDQMQAGGEE